MPRPLGVDNRIPRLREGCEAGGFVKAGQRASFDPNASCCCGHNVCCFCGSPHPEQIRYRTPRTGRVPFRAVIEEFVSL